ncbi:hypothetical protein MUK42_05502 [Musa troglodytarum]|uniref:Uncharacterized protein n=1 Tax=Musa troglodytarum TaxID=320322 RepID=A0A9E7FIQ6_9LILI|nr:hypothetical protein MUK42_05502 [Musa troglodytarum]
MAIIFAGVDSMAMLVNDKYGCFPASLTKYAELARRRVLLEARRLSHALLPALVGERESWFGAAAAATDGGSGGDVSYCIASLHSALVTTEPNSLTVSSSSSKSSYRSSSFSRVCIKEAICCSTPSQSPSAWRRRTSPVASRARTPTN